MLGTEKEQEIANALKERLGQNLLDIRIQRPRRIFATVSPSNLQDSVRFLLEKFDMKHVATITGIDLGKEIGVYYHLRDGVITLSLKVDTPKTEPKLPTITSIIPGAEFYEREVHDLFGVVFDGHPDLSPLILPEGWPENVFPLRKEWKTEMIIAEIEKTQGKKT